MQDIKQREEKMQEKRKQTPWREFVKDICSRQSFMFYKDKGIISKYHKNKRIPKIIANDEYFAKHETFTEGRQYDLGKDFFTNFNGIYQSVTLPATYQFAGLENVAYSDITHDSKNVYLSIMTTTGSSDVLYSCSVKQNSHNVLNSL
ncbi:MAG: hypothetical protein WCL18_06530 [bacterium]